MQFYLEQIDRKEHEVHVLYWNRDGKPEKRENGVIYHEFNYVLSDDIARLRKLDGFAKYKRFAINLLKKEPFDFVIVMHSIPAFLLGNYITAHFQNRFIFDYRDYTYEWIPPFKRRIHKVVNCSYATFVSSNGFRFTLPDAPHIYTSHNILVESLAHRKHPAPRCPPPLRIAFWGYIRHESINRQIIDRLANDHRFELHFYGKEQEIAQRLKKHVAEHHVQNVFFHGEYCAEDRYRFSQETELLHNIYSNTEAPSQQYAMTNKYYDGLAFYLPQLCMKESYMAQTAQKNGVGVACDPWEESFPDKIFDYYLHLDWERFRASCDRTLEKIMQEYNEGRKIIYNAVENAKVCSR